MWRSFLQLLTAYHSVLSASTVFRLVLVLVFEDAAAAAAAIAAAITWIRTKVPVLVLVLVFEKNDYQVDRRSRMSSLALGRKMVDASCETVNENI